MRLEALHGASRFCRLKGRFEQGYQLAKSGLSIGRPDDGLFVETWIQDYGLLDELAVNAYWARHFEDSLRACETLLSSGTCPSTERDRIVANAGFARQKLQTPAAAPTLGVEAAQASRSPKIAVYTIALNEAHHAERWSASARDAD